MRNVLISTLSQVAELSIFAAAAIALTAGMLYLR